MASIIHEITPKKGQRLYRDDRKTVRYVVPSEAPLSSPEHLGHLVIDDMVFCQHGFEYCNDCQVDFGILNDRYYFEYLKSKGEKEPEKKVDATHLSKNPKVEETHKDSSLSVDQLQAYLAAMDLDTSSVKNEKKELVDLLEKALGKSQNLNFIIRERNPSKLPDWSTPTTDVLNTFSLMDARNKFLGEINTNTIYNLRKMLLGIGDAMDRHYPKERRVIIQDIAQTIGIVLDIESIKKVASENNGEGDFPLFLVRYSIHDRRTTTLSSLDAVMHNPIEGKGIFELKATVDEINFFNQVLMFNNKRLSAEYRKIWRTSPQNKIIRRIMSPSFLVPFAPPAEGAAIVGSRCAVCGIKAHRKCSGCKTTYYCGSECQTADYKKHKKACDAATSGTPEKINGAFIVKLGMSDAFSQHMVVSVGSSKQMTVDQTKIPKNIHGDKQFVIKVQAAVGAYGLPLFVYDQMRSMSFKVGNEQGESYDLLKEIIGNRELSGLKKYFYALRRGDIVQVLLDEVPSQKQFW